MFVIYTIGTFLKKAWDWITDWFEYGDLVPLLVLVSAVHYASVLKGKDDLPVAVAIGMLVDLGHFRTVRAAFRYSVVRPKRRRKPADSAPWYRWVGYWWSERTSRINGQLVARWVIALVMTGISLTYHQRYYNDLWLSAPLPFLIAALAWLQRVDQRTKARPTGAAPLITVERPAHRSLPARQPAAVSLPAPLPNEINETGLADSSLVSETNETPSAARYACECGFATDNQRVFAGHRAAEGRAKKKVAALAGVVETAELHTSPNGKGNK